MKYLICFLFFQTAHFAQVNSVYSSVEKTMKAIPQNQIKTSKDIANYIKEHFTSEEQQIKAAYYYVISNLSYDVTHEFTVNLVITEDDMVSKASATKKGVCIHYARFFKDIITQLGYNCQVISGYTKKSNNTIAELSHAWCAIKMSDEKWYVFDPTWDSGYIQNGNFVRKLNSKYYKIAPSQSIKTHMPFDYIWQFSNFPINEKQFADSNVALISKNESFDFDKAIDNYLTLSEENQLRELKTRMIQTGHTSKLAQERFDILTKQTAVLDMNENIKKYNLISDNYNAAINLLNEFISYRNTQFKPEKKDESILKMITEPLAIFEKCNDEIYKIGFIGQDNLYGLNKFKRGLFDVIEETKKHKQFVEDYIKSNNRDRKKMFETKKVRVTF
jgi:hypothetical protein